MFMDDIDIHKHIKRYKKSTNSLHRTLNMFEIKIAVEKFQDTDVGKNFIVKSGIGYVLLWYKYSKKICYQITYYLNNPNCESDICKINISNLCPLFNSYNI